LFLLSSSLSSSSSFSDSRVTLYSCQVSLFELLREEKGKRNKSARSSSSSTFLC
jgi:hypothetical protein